MTSGVIVILFLAVGACLLALSAYRRAIEHLTDSRRRWRRCGRELTELINRLVQEAATVSRLQQELCDFCLTKLEASGVMLYSARGRASEQTELRVETRSGACSYWALGGEGEGEANEKPVILLAHGNPYAFDWRPRPQLLRQEDHRVWLPPAVSQDMGAGMLMPIRMGMEEPCTVLAYRRASGPDFTPEDEYLLAQLVFMAELGCMALAAKQDRMALEHTLHEAHEEGMLQISRGIIHNIGNGITVIQLALERLRGDEFAASGELAAFVVDEILPTLEEHLADGSLTEFLRDAPEGQEYLAALKTLMAQIRNSIGQHNEELEFLVAKFKNIIEIIALQQQFIGELGTENVVSITAVLEDVMKMCSTPLENRGIALEKKFHAKSQVLVDPAMLRHLLVLLMKHAIEAAGASRKASAVIRLATSQSLNEQVERVRLTIEDDGAGLELEGGLDEALLTSNLSPPDQERVRELRFCRDRILKYGGSFEIKTDLSHGTKVVIELPTYADEQDGE